MYTESLGRLANVTRIREKNAHYLFESIKIWQIWRIAPKTRTRAARTLAKCHCCNYDKSVDAPANPLHIALKCFVTSRASTRVCCPFDMCNMSIKNECSVTTSRSAAVILHVALISIFTNIAHTRVHARVSMTPAKSKAHALVLNKSKPNKSRYFDLCSVGLRAYLGLFKVFNKSSGLSVPQMPNTCRIPAIFLDSENSKCLFDIVRME